MGSVMTSAGKLALVVLLALVGPSAITIVMHWDTIKKIGQVSPEEAQGYLLYFTAPG